MKQIKVFLKNFWKDEDAQGATEYILILVAIVAVLGIFRKQITDVLKDKIGAVSGDILNF